MRHDAVSDAVSSDAVVIGAGIAGCALAFCAARRGVRVAVLEAEDHLGYHASGRSAAVATALDDNPTVQALKIQGRAFLDAPPPGLLQRPVIDQRGTLKLFTESGWRAFETDFVRAQAAGIDIHALEPAQAVARVPALRAGSFARAALVPADGNIDVHELLHSYKRAAEAHGAVFHLGQRARAIRLEGGRCAAVVTDSGEHRCDWVVDAAGAWAGQVAELAGATPIPFQPRRRCAIVFDRPAGYQIADWPLVVAMNHDFYFKPESGGLLFSPMDQVTQHPHDVRPDDTTIAAGFERLGQLAPTLVPTAVRKRWAGLRTFSPDDVPVVGRDPRRPGFFWLAGQAGFGVESSGALGQIAADLLIDGHTQRVDASALAPDRFA